MREQRRSRVIAMSPEELDTFLAEQRTCRMATVGPGGPNVSPPSSDVETYMLWLATPLARLW